MNGIHDLGGLDGFGPVERERDEPVFHADWERRVFGVAALMIPQFFTNAGTFRHAIERMDPVHYLGSSYYEHWLTALATLLVERGMIDRAALEERAGGTVPLGRPVRPGPLPTTGDPEHPRFALGDRVIVIDRHPSGHTRCPRYVRGKPGVIVRVDRAFPLNDVTAHSDARCKEWTYGIGFDAADLWGDVAGAGERVHVDLWESHLALAAAPARARTWRTPRRRRPSRP